MSKEEFKELEGTLDEQKKLQALRINYMKNYVNVKKNMKMFATRYPSSVK